MTADLRRYQPSIVETWKQLEVGDEKRRVLWRNPQHSKMLSHGGLKQDYDDMKMIRDYFSYEHFYVIYCPELVRKEVATKSRQSCKARSGSWTPTTTSS